VVPTWSKKSNPTEGSQGPPWSGFLWSLWSHLSLPSHSHPPPQPLRSFCVSLPQIVLSGAFELVTLLPGMIFIFLLFKSAQISVSQVGFPGGSLGTGDWSYCCSTAKSCPTLCDPMGCSTPGYPVLHYLLELVQIHVYWVSDHQTISFCHLLLLLPSIFPNIRVLSNESALCIRWPKYWSFSISPSNEYSGWISFRIG